MEQLIWWSFDKRNIDTGRIHRSPIHTNIHFVRAKQIILLDARYNSFDLKIEKWKQIFTKYILLNVLLNFTVGSKTQAHTWMRLRACKFDPLVHCSVCVPICRYLVNLNDNGGNWFTGSAPLANNFELRCKPVWPYILFNRRKSHHFFFTLCMYSNI